MLQCFKNWSVIESKKLPTHGLMVEPVVDSRSNRNIINIFLYYKK